MLLCAQEETDSNTAVKTQMATGKTRLLSVICYTVYTVYCSLGKIWHEKIFIGCQVRQKLNKQIFSYHKEIKQFIMVCSMLRQNFFTMDFFS